MFDKQDEGDIQVDTLDYESGVFECVVENDFGKITRRFNANILPKESPKIRTKRSVSAKEGEKAELVCECSNCLPVLEATWKFDTPSRLSLYQVKDKATGSLQARLDIDNVHKRDNGSYTCNMKNSLGSDSATINLIVSSPLRPPKIKISDGSKVTEVEDFATALKHKRIQLTCYTEAQSVKWTKDDVFYSNERTIIFPTITEGDIGIYKCIAENPDDSKSTEVELIVEYPPELQDGTAARRSLNLIENEDAVIDCNIVGDPVPDITWQINGNPVVESSKYALKFRGKKLIFKVDRSDHGTMTCEARNVHGSMAVNFDVQVQGN
jgi:Immunoglobulin I-set domain